MEERASRLPFAIAGLCAAVAAAWVTQLASGEMDGDWLLAGVMSLGFGVLAVNLLHRLAPGLFAGEDTEPDEVERDTVAEPAEVPPSPRLRVLLISSGLEAIAVALMVSYLVGDVLVAAGAGVALGALAAGVSLLLSRMLAPAG